MVGSSCSWVPTSTPPARPPRFGIAPDMAVRYQCDSVGTALNYEVISEAVSAVRACPQAALSSDWKDRIEEDFRRRGKK